MGPLDGRIAMRREFQIGGEMREDDGAAVGQKDRNDGVSRDAEKSGEEGEALDKKTRGSDAMRRAAARVLTAHCEAIAEGLGKRATDESHVQSIVLLCDLADEEKELSAELVKRCQQSLADKWENEPEWMALLEDAKNDPWSNAAPGPADRP